MAFPPRSEIRIMPRNANSPSPTADKAAGDARPPHGDRLERGQVRRVVEEVLAAQPVEDMHTHAYPATFGTPVRNASKKTDPDGLMLWGIDELVTYHYLIAEVYRVVPAAKLPYEQFWAMSKGAQADHIWKHLFVERTPISEACRGIITTIQKLGLDPADGLPRLR